MGRAGLRTPGDRRDQRPDPSTPPPPAAHQYGVVGVENSTEGVVTRSLDLFLHSPTHVVGEVSLLVRHHLLRSSNCSRASRPCWPIRRRWPSAGAG